MCFFVPGCHRLLTACTTYEGCPASGLLQLKRQSGGARLAEINVPGGGSMCRAAAEGRWLSLGWLQPLQWGPLIWECACGECAWVWWWTEVICSRVLRAAFAARQFCSKQVPAGVITDQTLQHCVILYPLQAFQHVAIRDFGGVCVSALILCHSSFCVVHIVHPAYIQT